MAKSHEAVPRSDSVAFHRDAANPIYPEPPDGLGADQADHFRMLCRCLHAADINDVIVTQLREAAVLWSQVRAMTIALDAEGPIILGPKGPYQSPKIAARRALHSQYLSATRLAGIDQIKRVQTLGQRAALSELRRTERAPGSVTNGDASLDESLFAIPTSDMAPRPRRSTPSYEDLYKRS